MGVADERRRHVFGETLVFLEIPIFGVSEFSSYVEIPERNGSVGGEGCLKWSKRVPEYSQHLMFIRV